MRTRNRLKNRGNLVPPIVGDLARVPPAVGGFLLI